MERAEALAALVSTARSYWFHRSRTPSVRPHSQFRLKDRTMLQTMIMRVDFYRGGDGRLSGWAATPPHRRRFQGSTMAAGRDLPHDLTQFTIERALEIRDGFWGVLAHGGWFA